MFGEPPVRGFATLCCLGAYEQIATELLMALTGSRLYDRMESLDLAVLGLAEDQRVVDDLIRPYEKVHVRRRCTALDEYEFPALELAQETCRTWSGLVFYIHGKGVSRSPLDQNGRYWRALMLDHVVHRHAECIALLRDHDTAGTNWRWNHYSGNFWWARSDYIRRLPDIESLRRRPRFITRDPVWNVRLQCEFWIGMGGARAANVGARGVDLGRTFRWAMSASDVVNQLLAALGGDRYGEIVVGEASPYADRVEAGTRRHFAAETGPPDDAPYDVVLVDGWHEESACYNDLVAATKLLRRGGAVVVHDTNPPTRWHQRDSAEFEPGSEWNGAAWRAVHRFRRERPDTWVRTVDTDWGCTVVIPDLADPLPSSSGSDGAVEDDTWEWFERHRDHVLRLVSPSEFRRLMVALPFATGASSISSRTDLLNCLVAWPRLERYLEIHAVGDNFEGVIAPVRHCVDPEPGATFQMSSDEFFASGRGFLTYDLILLDGGHEEEQVLRDVEHALARLSPHGRIVLHDANPPTAWHQRRVEEYRPGEDWNGTVWKAVVRTRARHPELSVITLDVDWGCSVLRRTTRLQPRLNLPPFLTWEYFDARRDTLLNLKPPTFQDAMGLA